MTEDEAYNGLLKHFNTVSKVSYRTIQDRTDTTFKLGLQYGNSIYTFLLDHTLWNGQPHRMTITTEKGREIKSYLVRGSTIEMVYQSVIHDIEKRITKKYRDDGGDIKFNLICNLQAELLQNECKTTRFRKGDVDFLVYEAIIAKIYIIIEDNDVIIRFKEYYNLRDTKNPNTFKICSLDNPHTDMCNRIIKILKRADTVMKGTI